VEANAQKKREMSTVTIFLIAASITVAISVAVVLFIRRHLRNVLIDLTGTESRADFWAAFTSLMLLLVPAIVAMFVPLNGQSDERVFFQVTGILRWSLIGLAATLVTYGFIIIWFVQTRPHQPPQWIQPYQPQPLHNPPMQGTGGSGTP
jgi:hypothetical protein